MEDIEEISEQERQKLLNRLHKSLFWVGEAIPRKVRIEGKDVDLHEIVWEIVNRPKLNKDELDNIDQFLEMLCEKEREYEERLETEPLSCEQAKALFDKAAGVRRAMMDLKELTTPSKRKAIFKNRHICEDVDTEKWDELADKIKKRGCQF
ncbi:DUF5788 family protein [Methanolobus sp. WCC4]|uniref:DUF5788 family protein n=1 Tax=Methanolobus sp. WCC4 TaxID=3125784 RepID=UPI0030F6E6A0